MAIGLRQGKQGKQGKGVRRAVLVATRTEWFVFKADRTFVRAERAKAAVGCGIG